MKEGRRAIVVVTTVGDEEQGNSIARELIGRRHAACVNMIPGVRSVYRWKGKICRDSEFLLVIKSMEDEFPAIAETIREIHEYEVPEILAFNVGRGDAKFLDWVAASLDKDAPFEEEEDVPDID